MSLQSLARVLIRASRRYGRVESLSKRETETLLETELIKPVAPDSPWPKYKLTKLGWDLARRLDKDPASAMAEFG